MASAAAMLSGLVVSNASASNLGDLQAQAQAIESRISALGSQENLLSERFDAANVALGEVRQKVAVARAQVLSATGKAGAAEKVLRADAVNAYVSSGSSSLSGSGPASSIAGADSSLLRAEYEQSLATNQTDSEDQYRLASRLASTAEDHLRVEEAAAAANVTTIATDEKQVQSTATSLESTEAQDKGQIATLIAQQQAAALKAQQIAADQRLAAQRAAQAAAQQQAAAAQAATSQTTVASTPAATTGTTGATTAPTPGSSTTTVGPVSTTPPPPVVSDPPSSSVGARAVAYAESRVGDPYVWGAAGPSSFDCSGLVMWAYAQAGVSLPHYSGAQYADTTHISMADLEPGDLVFFADPGQHVAMYVGNGDVVQAPYTGADVQIVPLYSEFVLASRVG